MLAVYAGFSIFEDAMDTLLLIGLFCLFLLGCLFGGMWYAGSMLSLSQADESMSGIVGWSLFGSCGILCAITGRLIFVLTLVEGGHHLYWISTIFFGLPYLLASLGFVQIVGDLPFTCVPRNWNTLGVWRQLTLVTFVTGAIGFASLCVYYLVILNETGIDAVQYHE